MGTDWSLAKCIGHTDLFFDERPGHIAVAKALCNVCPIRQDCLLWALEHQECYGVWGGQDYEELRITAALLGYKQPNRQEEVSHGTEKGFAWHQRTGTPIEYDEEGVDVCGCQSAARKAARERMAKYRKRLRSRRLLEGDL